MVTADERMRILEMLHEGKLTPEGAAQLLQALESDQPRPSSTRQPSGFGFKSSFGPDRLRSERNTVQEYPTQEPLPEAGMKGNGKWLRVRVTDTNTGRPRVNVRIPIGLVNLGMKIGSRFAPEIDGIDMAALLQAAQNGETGPMVDVYDEDEGEHVEVFIE